MWPFRKRRRHTYRSWQEKHDTEMAILRAKADREDAVCAVFGPDCEKVESCWDWPYYGVALRVTYKDRTEDVLIGDPRVAAVAALL